MNRASALKLRPLEGAALRHDPGSRRIDSDLDPDEGSGRPEDLIDIGYLRMRLEDDAKE